MEVNSVEEFENTGIFEDVTSTSNIVFSDTKRMTQNLERMMSEEAVSFRKLTMKWQARGLSPVQEE